MTPTTLELAIVQTLAYADVFNFPMMADEIHHFLLGVSAKKVDVYTALNQPSTWLNEHIRSAEVNGTLFYALRIAASDIFEQRQQRQKVSSILWEKALYYGAWLGCLPFVRMVAITGALSVHNAAHLEDDLDYILVVQDGRVWLARLFAVALVRFVRLRGVTLCPNYVLSTEAMALDSSNLFLAHELTQMIPLFGYNFYEQMRELNRWADTFLPNAQKPFYPTREYVPKRVLGMFKKLGEWVLKGALGDKLEAWEMRRKLKKLSVQSEDTDEVKLDSQQVKGHFMSYGRMTLERYQARLVKLGLMPEPREQSSAAD